MPNNLLYERKLSPLESEQLRHKLQVIFDYNGFYWYPMNGEEDKPKLPVVFVCVCNFQYENEIAVNEFLLRNSKDGRFYIFREDFDDSQIQLNEDDEEISELTEAVMFDDSFEWLIYGSHEGSITFSGDKLVKFIEALYKNRREKLNFWEWS